MAAGGLGDVENHDRGVLPEGAAEAEPEVHGDADHERDVRLRQGEGAGAREEERMVGWDAAARKAVEEDGDAQRLGELEEGLLAMTPVEVGAGHDDGPLGLAEQASNPLDLGGVRAPYGLPHAYAWGSGFGSAHEDVVEREVEKGGAPVRSE